MNNEDVNITFNNKVENQIGQHQRVHVATWHQVCPKLGT